MIAGDGNSQQLPRASDPRWAGSILPLGPVMEWATEKTAKTLTVGDRRGSFPGMLRERTLHIVFVGPGQGAGIEAAPGAARTVRYTGEAIAVKP